MEIKWIKMMVGMFDGSSFKKIKKATLKDGTAYRDKLTSVWFELLDLAGKRNEEGKLCNLDDLEIPFNKEAQFEDIATMIDRQPEELECCIAWFIKNKMITIIDDVYALSNWSKFQELDKLELIRENNKKRQKRFYDRKKSLGNDNHNVRPNVSLTQPNALDIDIEEDIELKKEKEYINTYCPSETEKNEKNSVFKNEVLEIFDFWNSKNIINHKKITKEISQIIEKTLKENSSEEILKAIENYSIVLNDEKYFFKYKWDLKSFLKQKNGMNEFLDEGAKWQAYLNSRSGKKLEERKMMENVDFSGFM